MNLLDLGIIVLLALVTLRGYYRGLFQELAVLVGVVGGLLAAAHSYISVGAKLQRLIANPTYAKWAAFVLVLVTVYWLTRLVGHLLQRLLYHLYLDLFDRLMGGFFALVKGGLFVGFALMLVGVVLPRNSQLFKESRTAPHLTHFARQTLGLLPADFKQRLQDYLREWQQPQKKQDAKYSAGVLGATGDAHTGKSPPATDQRSGGKDSRPGPGGPPANPGGSSLR
jgi:membrane protein required for colicin V production